MKYYLAYGSNLNLMQMRRRCPDSRPVSQVEIKGWRLAFRTYLDIEPGKKTDRVICGLYLISERDEAALDRYEGVGTSGRYEKVWLDLKINGAQDKALIYIMKDQSYLSPCFPAYFDCVSWGFRDWGIAEGPLDKAHQRAVRAIEELDGNVVQARLAR